MWQSVMEVTLDIGSAAERASDADETNDNSAERFETAFHLLLDTQYRLLS